MKKESAATLPAIPDDPSVPVTYIPHPTAEKRERISFADLWPSRETQGGRRGAPMAIIACAALLSAACLLALYGVSARLTGEWSWSAPWEALQGFLQGGGGGSALPSVPVDPESEEDPTAETEFPGEPSGTVGEPSDTVNGEGSSEPPADLPTAEDGTVTDAPTQDGGTATDEPTADESLTQEPPTDIPDPEPSVPAGMIPIVGQDVSQADKGIDYVIRDSGEKEPYIGCTPLVSGEIAEDVTSYYATSEQTPTGCALGVLVNPDLTVKTAGGLLIQLLPFCPEDVIDQLEKNIATLPPMTELLSAGLSPEDILARALTDMPFDVLDTYEPAYRCNCSREKVIGAFATLTAKELREMPDEEGKVEATCRFCDAVYRFEREELERMAAEREG